MSTIVESAPERFLEFDPATLYEAAGKRGMVSPSIRPVWPDARICGPAVTVQCPPGDNLMLHHAVATASPGSVLVATTGNYCFAGAWGEILTVAAQVRGITGLVIDGAVRDVKAIAEYRFPVFSGGFAVGSCTKSRPGKLNVPISLGGITIRPGDLIFGGLDGVVVLEKERLDEVYEAALTRQKHEADLMVQLRSGKTTVELLNLPRVS